MTRRHRLGACIAALITSFTSACEQQKALFYASGQTGCRLMKVGELPLIEREKHLFIGATVQHHPLSLMFDTGADQTFLNEDKIAILALSGRQGKVGKAEVIGGTIPLTSYRLRFGLNGIPGDWLRVVFASKLGGSFDGVISPGFFLGHDIDLDLPDKRLILYFPQHDCSSPSAVLHGNLYPVPLVHSALDLLPASKVSHQGLVVWEMLSNASPSVIVSVNGHELVAGVDSGAPYNVMFLGGVSKLGLTPADVARDARTRVYGLSAGSVPAIRHVIETADIGDLRISNLPVLISGQNDIGIDDMLLGTDFIKRVHVWISYSSDSLILQYPPASSPGIGDSAEAGMPADAR